MLVHTLQYAKQRATIAMEKDVVITNETSEAMRTIVSISTVSSMFSIVSLRLVIRVSILI